MSGERTDGPPPGKFIRVATALPTAVVDCSAWEPDIPADQWTTGRLVRVADNLPTAVVGCDGWDHPTRLELVADPADAPPPIRDRVRNLLAVLGKYTDVPLEEAAAPDRLTFRVTADVPPARLAELAADIERALADVPVRCRLVG